MDIWSILGIAPTRDSSAIRRAYAQKARDCHPEEDPEGFLQLRQAYQGALSQAEAGEACAPSPAPRPELEKTERDAPQTETGFWSIPEELPEYGPNPFEDHPAIWQFRELYTGKQRKNSKLWLDYFTSVPFLEVYRERQFTALLLNEVTQAEPELTPGREFLTWLYAVYQFSGQKNVYQDRTELQFQVHKGARFDGLDSIFAIARKGPVPKRAAGNELAILTSFQEYCHLLRLAELGDWGEQAVDEFSHIIGRYSLSYIQDKYDPRKYADCQRHPAGVRILTHFFEASSLPEELYRIAWQKLDLKNAIMGRAKIIYGPLRDIILSRIPALETETAERFFKLRQDFTPYAVSCYHSGCQNEPEDRARTDAFFAREDFQRALLNRQFVEQDILHTWVDEDRCDYYLARIIDFYRQHPAAPYAEKVIRRAEDMLKLRAARRQIEADKNAPVPETLTLSCRPFLRHWLNTGFYLAHSPESGRPLSAYLQEHMPFLPQWSQRFLGTEEGTLPLPRTAPLTIEGVPVEVRFHLRYIDYLVDGELACQPFLEWSELNRTAGPEEFFLLLPAAAAAYSSYQEVKQALLLRLTEAGVQEEGLEEIAACLAGQVCRLPLREDGSLVPPEEVLPLEWFAEDGERLLGCSWSPRDQVLSFFEQTPAGRRLQPNGGLFDGISTPQAAVELAQVLLEDAVSPTGIHLELLANLPAAVYTEPDFSAICRSKGRWGSDMPRTLLGEQVTREALAELFALFADGRIKRLELSWPTGFPAEEPEPEYESRRSLVFLHEPAGWACLYFDDFKAQAFALVAWWEDYLRVDINDLTFLPFREDKLHYYDVHSSFSTIRRHLDTVFRQASWPNGVDLHAGQLWSYPLGINHSRYKYNLDKRLLGGFPLEWSRNRLAERFYLSAYPHLAVWEDGQGMQETLELGNFNRDRLQQVLGGFMLGSFARLRLTWGKADGQCHIVMLQDQGRFLLVWLSDKTEQALFHVADVPVYRDVEGKKYPKDTFLARVTPAYLIHPEAASLRGALEHLLARAEDPAPFLNKFAEFAPESPVKPRPYAAIRTDLVGER